MRPVKLRALTLALLLLPAVASVAEATKEHWSGAGEGKARVSRIDCGAAFVVEIDRQAEGALWDIRLIVTPIAKWTQPLECVLPFLSTWRGVPGDPSYGWSLQDQTECGTARIAVGRIGTLPAGATSVVFARSAGCGGEYGSGTVAFAAEDPYL